MLLVIGWWFGGGLGGVVWGVGGICYEFIGIVGGFGGEGGGIFIYFDFWVFDIFW